MTADEKKIQDLCIEIDKLKAELAKSKKELEESKGCLQKWHELTVNYPRCLGRFDRDWFVRYFLLHFLENPEQCEHKENR